MLTVKYLLEVAGFVLMAAAAAILVHDLFRLYQQSNLIEALGAVSGSMDSAADAWGVLES